MKKLILGTTQQIVARKVTSLTELFNRTSLPSCILRLQRLMRSIDKHYLHYSKDKSQKHIGISQNHYMSILRRPPVFVQTEKSKPYIRTQVDISYFVDASDYEFGIPLSTTLNFSLHHCGLEG